LDYTEIGANISVKVFKFIWAAGFDEDAYQVNLRLRFLPVQIF
jgi:hypothetical protein